MTVIEEIAAERQRQKDVEGWTPEHDDQHDTGSLAVAAACYALGSADIRRGVGDYDHVHATVSIRLWPWAPEWWKPKRTRRNLVRAAALLVAEIERIDREEQRRTAA